MVKIKSNNYSLLFVSNTFLFETIIKIVIFSLTIYFVPPTKYGFLKITLDSIILVLSNLNKKKPL